LVKNGFNYVTGIDKKKIIETTKLLLNKKFHSDNSLYGGGTAAFKIVEKLLLEVQQ